MKKKILVFTGSRADYSLLSPLISKIKSIRKYKLIIVAGGNHFSKIYGNTFTEILKDKIKIDFFYKFNPLSTKNDEIINYIGSSIIKFFNFVNKKKPNIAIILGDRYEAFSFSLACFFSGIKIAHLHGGEVTTGAYDDSLRHSITKFSDLHFVCHNNYKKRVIQLGENPNKIFNVGSLGVESIFEKKLYNSNLLYKKFNIPFNKTKALATFHPETQDREKIKRQIDNFLLGILKKKNIFYIITYSNADTFGRYFIYKIKKLSKQKNIKIFPSLGSINYLSIMKNVDFVVGNSSSGIIEAPALKTPTINIGQRQNGREFSKSIYTCSNNPKEIEYTINRVLKDKINKKIKYDNIFYKKNTSKNILKIIDNFLAYKNSQPKEFYDI